MNPEDYKYVRAWGSVLCLPNYAIAAAQRKAAESDAPADSVYFIDSKTFDGIYRRSWVRLVDCDPLTQEILINRLHLIEKRERLWREMNDGYKSQDALTIGTLRDMARKVEDLKSRLPMYDAALVKASPNLFSLISSSPLSQSMAVEESPVLPPDFMVFLDARNHILKIVRVVYDASNGDLAE